MIKTTLKSSEKNVKVLYLAFWCTVCNLEGIARRLAAIFFASTDGRPILAERKQKILHPKHRKKNHYKNNKT